MQIIPSMQGAQGAIATELAGISATAGATSGAALGGNLVAGLSSSLSKFVLPAAILAIGAELVNIGGDFDAMYDIIRTGTGATGEAFDDLAESARSIAQNVPNDLDDVGQTVADLNTRLGVTGDELEDLATKYLQASNALGTEIDVNKTTAAFNAFHLEGQAASDALDDLFTVSQMTGIGMNELAGAISSNAASMQMLGFSFQDTAAMAGLLDKAGISASGAFSKMSKGLVTLAKDGEEPAEAFQRLTGEMQDYLDAGDEAAALNIASQLFGTRGASQFIAALQSGALNIDEITAALEDNQDAIGENAKATESMGEKLQTIWNNVLIAVEPIASFLFDAISDTLTAIMPYIQAFANFINRILTTIKNAIQFFVDFFKRIVSGDWKGAWQMLKDVASRLMESLKSGIKAFWENIKDWFKSLPGKIKDWFKDSINWLYEAGKNLIKGLWNGIVDWFESIPNRFGNWLKDKFGGSFTVNLPGGMTATVPLEVDAQFATGGIVTAPTRALIGEAGAEAIIPLTSPHVQTFADAVASSMNGGGNVTNIYIDGARVNDDAAIESSFYGFMSDLKRLAVMQGV